METTPVSLPENPIGRGAWRAPVHRVAESDATERLRNNNQERLENVVWALESPHSSGQMNGLRSVLRAHALMQGRLEGGLFRG